ARLAQARHRVTGEVDFVAEGHLLLWDAVRVDGIHGLVSDLDLEAALSERRSADTRGGEDGRAVAQVTDRRADGVAVDDAPVLRLGVLATSEGAAQEQAGSSQRERRHSRHAPSLE